MQQAAAGQLLWVVSERVQRQVGYGEYENDYRVIASTPSRRGAELIVQAETTQYEHHDDGRISVTVREGEFTLTPTNVVEMPDADRS